MKVDRQEGSAAIRTAPFLSFLAIAASGLERAVAPDHFFYFFAFFGEHLASNYQHYSQS